MADALALKVCTFCGEDCSKRKRTRDSFGRYACAACVDRATTEPRSLPGTPSSISAQPAAVFDLAEMQICRRCSNATPVSAMICVHCGLDSRSAFTPQTTEIRQAAAPRVYEYSRLSRINISPWAAFFLILIPIMALCSVGGLFQSRLPVVVAAGVLILAYIAVILGIAMEAMRSSLVWRILVLIGVVVPPVGMWTISVYAFWVGVSEVLAKSWYAVVLGAIVVMLGLGSTPPGGP